MAGVPRPALSVVVPTHAGSIGWLADCLAGLGEQTLGAGSWELLVVLDGPAPEVAALVRRAAPRARRLDLARNRGFSAAASAGLRAARGALVGVLNDDAVPEPGWASALVDAAERYPDAGSFASRVVQAGDPARIDSAGHGLTRWGEPFAIGHGDRDGPRYDADEPVFGAPASASAYRRELIRDCGAFDVAMEAYLEDVDLSLRAQLLGFPCWYVAGARVRHRGGASYSEARAVRLVARNRLHLALKSMPRNTLRAGGPAAAAAIACDLVHRAARGRSALEALRGTLDGLEGARTSLGGRPRALGSRRIDDRALAEVLRRSEERLRELGTSPDAGQARRARATLSRVLTAWVDRRQRRIERPPW